MNRLNPQNIYMSANYLHTLVILYNLTQWHYEKIEPINKYQQASKLKRQ